MIPYTSECKLVTPVPEANESDVHKSRLELLFEVSKKVNSVSRLNSLLNQTIEMTRCTLNAGAASILLIDDNDQELYFKVASGPVEEVLRKTKVDAKHGIAGWVARTGKPVIVSDVNKDDRFNRVIDDSTGFTTKSMVCVPLSVQKKTIGVLEVLNKLDGTDFTEHDLGSVVSVATTVAMAIENARLHSTVLEAYKSTIQTLAAAIDAKDPYTCGHSRRVMQYALLAGTALSLPAEELEILEYAAILHDVGKIAIEDRILNKPGTLTPAEWQIMRGHPVTGANIMKEISFLEKASELVLHHHERYDGTGYPVGLSGEEIPMGARIIAVADAFDTMTTDRAYRPALTVDYTVSEMYGCAGTQFCPVAVDAFVSVYFSAQRT